MYLQMSTRAQQAQLLRNPVFLDQLAGCLLAAASNVLNEDPATPLHLVRRNYANAIIANPLEQATFLAPGMLTNATVAAEAGNAAGESGTPVTDNDCDFVVASLFEKYAKQFALQERIGASLGL
jgi:hypothetical protein